ncbi:MAG: hypothetical protein QXT63_00610 [Thermoplasmata archaeon]
MPESNENADLDSMKKTLAINMIKLCELNIKELQSARIDVSSAQNMLELAKLFMKSKKFFNAWLQAKRCLETLDKLGLRKKKMQDKVDVLRSIIRDAEKKGADMRNALAICQEAQEAINRDDLDAVFPILDKAFALMQTHSRDTCSTLLPVINFWLENARLAGAEVSKSQTLYEEAIKAIEEKRFDAALNSALRSCEELDRAKIALLADLISSTQFEIEELKTSGIAVEECETLVAQAEDCAAEMDTCMKLAQYLSVRANPGILCSSCGSTFSEKDVAVMCSCGLGYHIKCAVYLGFCRNCNKYICNGLFGNFDKGLALVHQAKDLIQSLGKKKIKLIETQKEPKIKIRKPQNP